MIIKLTIGNSYCLIENLSIEQHKALKDVLSYELDPKANYFSGGFRPRKQSLLSAKGSFPTGLLSLVKKFIIDQKIETYVEDDIRALPMPLESTISLSLHVTPYTEQIEAAEACQRAKRGIVRAVTGFGKSITMALLIEKLQMRTLIIVPNLELKRQLTDSFKQYFGSLGNITIENIDSRTLLKANDYDCLIIDEAHHVAAKTYRKLNKSVWNGIYYRFFFTATPFRSRDEEQLLFQSIAGDLIYDVSYDTAVKKGYIVPMEAYYIEVPKTKTTANTWPQVYSQLIVHNEVRNQYIINLLTSLKNESTLCLVKELAHGNILTKAIDGFFVHGTNEDTPYLIRLFNETKLKTLIGTTGVLGEGIDSRPCEYVIIAGLGKSKPQFMQSCGRAFRNSPGKTSAKIIIILDKSHKYLRDHYKAQVKYLGEEYGVIPTKLVINE